MALRIGNALPSFDGVSWIGSALNDEELRGRPVLVQFWAVSCPACLHSMPKLEKRRREFAELGLQFVSVHRPYAPGDSDVSKVEATLREFGFSGSCALDHDEVLAARFQTGDLWPYYFLFDGEGKMRSRAAGGNGFKIVESALQRLLASQTTTA